MSRFEDILACQVCQDGCCQPGVSAAGAAAAALHCGGGRRRRPRWRPQLWEVRHIPASLLSAGLLLQRLGDLTSMNLLLLWGYILHDCMGCCRHGLFELLSVLIRKHRDRSAFMQGRWRPHGTLRWRMRCRAPSGTRGRTWSAPRLSWRGTRASSSAPWPLSRQWACLTCGGVRPPHCCRPCLDIIMPDIVPDLGTSPAARCGVCCPPTAGRPDLDTCLCQAMPSRLFSTPRTHACGAVSKTVQGLGPDTGAELAHVHREAVPARHPGQEQYPCYFKRRREGCIERGCEGCM